MHSLTIHRCPMVVVLALIGWSAGPASAQGHAHRVHAHDSAGALLRIEQVLALPQNQGVLTGAANSATPGRSGDREFSFRVAVTSESLPEEVFEPSPFDTQRKRKILECAHGGFAHDHREGRGEVYWFLQGAGILRVASDRSKVDLIETDPRMVKLNMHNGTFFEHADQAMIAWPANGGAKVFITDVDGEVLHTIGRPTMEPYSDGAGFAPTDTAYLDGTLWVTDGYGSRFAMSYDLDEQEWNGTIFGGRSKEIEPGKFGTNHGITIHKGLLHFADRYFARIHSYRTDTSFVGMFPVPEGSMPCDFEFFVSGGKLYGVAGSLKTAKDSKDTGAAIYIVDMETLKIVSTVKPKDDLGLATFVHLHDVFPVVDDGAVTLFCQAWNPGDFAVLVQAK